MRTFDEVLEDCGSQLTRNSYLASMYGLMNVVYDIKPEKPLNKGWRRIYLDKIDEYLHLEKHNYLKDLTDYRNTMEDKAPRTMRSYLYNCKYIIEICTDYQFDRERKRRFASLVKGTRKPITQDAVLNHEIIRKIISHASVQARASILVMATSGVRIGELIKLKNENFDFEKRMITIPMQVSKTHERRITFFTSECAEALKIWMAYRPTYMKQIEKQCTRIKPGYKFDDQRMFPLSNTSLRESIHNATKNAGLKTIDQGTRRITIAPHSFRKWFSTTAKNTMNNDLVEVLMGHELPFGGAYFKMSEADMMKEYRRYENSLLIGSDENVRSTLENVESELSLLRSENLALKEGMDKMEKDILNKIIGQLQMA
jgi:integrase